MRRPVRVKTLLFLLTSRFSLHSVAQGCRNRLRKRPCNTRETALLAGLQREGVPGVGVEPTRGKSPRDFKSEVATSEPWCVVINPIKSPFYFTTDYIGLQGIEHN